MISNQNTQVVSMSGIAQVRVRLSELLRDRRGAAFTEYLIIVGIVALVGIGIFNKFRGGISDAVDGQKTKIGSLGK